MRIMTTRWWAVPAAVVLAALTGCASPAAPAGAAGTASATLETLAPPASELNVRHAAPAATRPAVLPAMRVAYHRRTTTNQAAAKAPNAPTTQPAVVVLVSDGVASYYSIRFDGRRTANGELFDIGDLTAAHLTLPFNTRVRVTNLENGKSVTVRINDRGPYVGHRCIDLSPAAALKLDMLSKGIARVKLEILPDEPTGTVARTE